jgi:hypothetical protein
MALAFEFIDIGGKEPVSDCGCLSLALHDRSRDEIQSVYQSISTRFGNLH